MTRWCLVALLGSSLFCGHPLAQSNPPFHGTIFIDPDLITPADPSSFKSLSFKGQSQRIMYDRRPNAWISVNAWIFDARFSDGKACEIQVNPEFSSEQDASQVAKQFGFVIGQLPAALRKDVETVWIHRGTNPFGGGNRNLLIHTGQADAYIAEGILEETLLHEASHTSLDSYHATAPGWVAAQSSDGQPISTYARDEPVREDVAESFLTWFAVRYRSDRITPSMKSSIETCIPSRLAYFDAQRFDLFPSVPEPTSIVRKQPDPSKKQSWRKSFDLNGRLWRSVERLSF
jgi:hypothetical protein